MRVFFLAAVVTALLPGGVSMALAQSEVSLLVPNPFRRTLDKVAGGFEPKTGYKLNVTLGRGMGTRQQIARGEMFDVSILLPPYPEALASGNIDPKSATVLARLVLAHPSRTPPRIPATLDNPPAPSPPRHPSPASK